MPKSELKKSRPPQGSRERQPMPSDGEDWPAQLDAMLLERRIREGMRLLDDNESEWQTLRFGKRSSSDLLLMLAQWVDLGYRNPQFLRGMLDRISPAERLQMGVGAFVRLNMAQAFCALATDDVDGAVRTLDVVLRLDRSLLDVEAQILAHLWKGRAHRKTAEYEIAFIHINAARELAATLAGAQVLTAVLQIQQGWLTFQRGDTATALRIFSEAEAVLRHTDHWIARGNIESARSRIIRRNGDYVRSIEHSNRAVEFYERGQPNHPNLARAVTNLAFVKRLLALQLRKHIDGSASRRTLPGAKNTSADRLRPLHKQYQELYRGAIAGLDRAKKIYILNEHHSGLAAAFLNAGYLHLDVGDLDLAEREAQQAYDIAEETHSVVLKARARTLSGLIANAHVEELLGHPEEAPAFARRAKQHCLEALALAQTTENKRLLLNAHLALGEVAANIFYNDYELTRRSVDAASALITADDADYVVEELNALKAKLLRTAGIDDTLRGWSQGIVQGKTMQEVLEQFAELVVTQVWLREDRKISRVAQQLAMSPKKVRRLIKYSGAPSLENGQTTIRKAV